MAELLYQQHPDWREGDLTRARAALVNGRFLADQASALGLAAYLVLGRTERSSGGTTKARVLANLFEAVIGALYLDGGLAPVFRLVERCFGEALAGDATLQRDPKTRFQEWAHATLRETPRYTVLEDSGVEAAEDRFTVAVTVGGEARARGRIVVSAYVPLAEVTDYQNRLKALTGGEGSFTLQLSHYDPVPPRRQAELASAWKPAAGEE